MLAVHKPHPQARYSMALVMGSANPSDYAALTTVGICEPVPMYPLPVVQRSRPATMSYVVQVNHPHHRHESSGGFLMPPRFIAGCRIQLPGSAVRRMSRGGTSGPRPSPPARLPPQWGVPPSLAMLAFRTAAPTPWGRRTTNATARLGKPLQARGMCRVGSSHNPTATCGYLSYPPVETLRRECALVTHILTCGNAVLPHKHGRVAEHSSPHSRED